MASRLHTIQSLRALAALFVLVSHALLYASSVDILSYGRLGWLGVILFFVVSGFIMVAVTGTGRFAPVKFLRRRVLRVVPLYWALTFVAAGLALFLPALVKSMQFDLGQFLLSLAFIPFYNPASLGLHPLYKLGWTLNYEMFFYVSFAALAVLMARQRVVVLTIVFAALMLAGWLFQPADAIPVFYTSFMPMAFVAGAWLGLAYVEGRLGNIGRTLVIALVVAGLAGLVEGFMVQSPVVEDGFAFIGFLAFATATVALAVGLESRLPRFPVLERLGDASYSIYLVHMFAVASTMGLLLHLVGPDNIWVELGAEAFAITGGVVLGWLVYRLVEAPLMRLFARRTG